MSLEILWFVLIAVLWVAFFFLEGFDFGVGMLQLFLGKNERERSTYIYAISPHWDGNEVWLITAGGAIFAAFPMWYAAFFSALYIPFVVLLLALIVRGVCFEFRHRMPVEKSRYACDIALAVSSLLCTVLFGIAMVDLAIGIPINFNGDFEGDFFDLVQPAALLSGLVTLSLFLTNGALFLSLKLEGELQDRVCKFLKKAIIASVVLIAIAAVLVFKYSALCFVPLAFILLAWFLVVKQYLKRAFFSVALCIASIVAILFFIMFPNVLVSTMPEYNLTIWNAASSAYTLKLMSIVALILVPIVIAYQIWSYYIFRKRISPRKANIEV